MRYFLCKDGDMWLDSWTYGDWRQYVCRRPCGALQCARLSMLPHALWGLGTALLMFLGVLCIFLLGVVPDSIYWDRVIAMVVLTLLCLVPYYADRWTGWRLMVAVGKKQPDGIRILGDE